MYPLRNWEAVIGSGTRPVSAEDMSLASHLGGLSKGAVTISPLITDQQSSKFNISRAFTNTGGADLSVNEIGIQTGRQDEFTRTPYTLLARDVLEAPLALPATKTLTLDYEILTQIENFNQDTALHGSNGGFTEAFTSMLRSLAVSDNSDSYHTQYFLSLFPGGGGGYMERSGNPIPGWKFGIRLGASSKFVSMTDTDLSPDATDQTPYDVGGIAHGTGDGLLVHHGMVADDAPVIDLEANQAWFNLHRIFENKGTVPITVKEIGIYGNSKSTYNYDFTPTLIARRALAPADQFTIQPGQAIQVTFTIKAVV
ncbi:hypothetical protein NC796_01855 [Aliifodinibius sp. S!AR15-10]|uniref:hypothetical protein n=1 Tax=Aliifodinibius sp. S!AR15-10 TaxID=2950437 RepID=UPI0028594758|nr:hypothetical protein [Aliifodinibius sp. S!AR15-10]MDR8389863.1 hypothetical protein [Aliifodinibius sp. S!AR15-10]